MRKINEKGQVWVETVIYTLIGLTIIGILLAVSKPKIDSIKDKLAIEQTIDSLSKIQATINEVNEYGAGNRRIVEVKISKGTFTINSSTNKLLWVLDSKYKYSEPGQEVSLGLSGLKILTTGSGPYVVAVSSSSNVDLTYSGQEEDKAISAAPTSYSFAVENFGGNKIDLSLR